MEDLSNDFLQELYEQGGFYTSFDSTGKRIGPMVGYAGRYIDGNNAKKQFIGDVYVNCSKLEKVPKKLGHFLRRISRSIEDMVYANGMADVLSSQSNNRVVLLGAPMGGIITAALLSMSLFSGNPEKTEFGFLEKKVTELATTESREKSELVFGRHDIFRDDVVIPIEDVCNNFSTTKQMLSLVFGKGVKVPCLFCLVNRSGKKSFSFDGKEISIVSIVESNWPQYEQEDPEIQNYISIPGNLILNPKLSWDKLMSDMANRE